MSIIEPTFPQSLGYCLYCGDDGDGLSEEHIIPFSFGGEWTLGRASCKACRDVTSQIEGRLMRGPLRAFRAAVGMPTRRPQEMPDSFRLALAKGEERLDVDLPVAGHPTPIALPRFDPPTVLSGVSSQAPERLRYVLRTHVPTLQEVGRATGASHFVADLTDALLWARFVAKVGLSFATGCIYPERLASSFVASLVLGTQADYWQHVGSNDGERVTNATRGHQVVLVAREGLLVAYIQLLAELKLPEYVVVVGVLGSSPQGGAI